MLYQTHLPIFFQFNTFSSITIPLSATATISTPLLPSSSSSSSIVQEMECVEAALKTNLRKEMALKPNPQGGFDDVCAVNLQNVDDFFVDDLLDFSNEDGEPQETQQKDEPKDEQSLSVSSPKQEQEQHEEEDNSLDDSFNFDDLGPIPASELAVPADDVANLEWLSHFVEDSFTEFSAPFPAGALPAKPKDDVSEPKAPSLASPCFKTPVPAKARSKRTRTGVRIWSLGSPSLSDSSSSSSISYSSSPSSPRLHYNNSGSTGSFGQAEQFSGEKLPKKKPKKKPQTEGLNGRVSGGGSLFVRRCSHCGVQKTPQWRTGPLGAKTLCNACGVRYKSGRLFPEYRPACSPTFSSELHSNHHRKVLEMRRKKELLGQAEPGLTPPVVPSF